MSNNYLSAMAVHMENSPEVPFLPVWEKAKPVFIRSLLFRAVVEQRMIRQSEEWVLTVGHKPAMCLRSGGY